jgi:ribosomal-protein-alanine N-acetyltransferase
MIEKLSFRVMELRDIDDILEIERLCFSAPWSRAAFVGELRDNHFARYLVALVDGKIVGYSGMWIIIDEAHITNIAVHPAYRGQKIGEAILRRMMGWAVAYGARRMTLEVRVSNLVAQQLYAKLGFVNCGLRKGYYTDNNEDAIIMWAELKVRDQAYGGPV